MKNRIALFTITIGLSLAAAVRADDNVREVQTKLSDEGLYFGEADGAYSPDLSTALTRYQVRKGLPITGQLDVETAEALGAKPAVGPSTAAAEQGSETWRRLRKHERRTSVNARRAETAATEARERSSASAKATADKSPATTARTSADTTGEASSVPEETVAETTPRATAADTGSATPEFSSERVRDYVAAFVLAGLDKNVGAETEFFADRVEYYDSGTMDREKIREDLKWYDERWPERHFWVAGAINIEPQSENRARVTFPMGFKLRNGGKQSSGKVNKTLVLESAGGDLQIVAVHERKSN